MKVDLYTKSVLTLIALSLVCIVARDVSFVPEAQAAPAGLSGTVDVNIISVGGHGFRRGDVNRFSPYLPVRVCE